MFPKLQQKILNSMVVGDSQSSQFFRQMNNKVLSKFKGRTLRYLIYKKFEKIKNFSSIKNWFLIFFTDLSQVNPWNIKNQKRNYHFWLPYATPWNKKKLEHFIDCPGLQYSMK